MKPFGQLTLLFAISLAVPPRYAEAAELDSYQQHVRPLVQAYCLDCHSSGADSDGGLDLDVFDTEASVAQSPQLFKSVFDRIRRHEMPPEEMPQPSDTQRGQLLDWVERFLARPTLGGQRDPGPTIVRRLTRLEYNNTVRDLLGLEHDLFLFSDRLPIDKEYFRPQTGALPMQMKVSAKEYGAKLPALLPHAGLPGENRAEHGFSSQADALSFSPLLMEKYLELSGQIVDSPNFVQQSRRLQHMWDTEVAVKAKPDPSQQNPGRSHAAQTVRSVGDFAPNDNVSETTSGAATSPNRFAGFIGRAFRRPVHDQEVDRYLRLYDALVDSGGSRDDALRSVIRAVLASPQFLYRIEQDDAAQSGSVRGLGDYELASRLSYFLWSSMPDDELLATAAAGRLTDPEVLEEQTRRMLRDPKSRELSESFAVQWLRLNQLFGSRPDRKRFKEFYSGPMGKNTLAMPMLIETLLLFETIHIEDRSILEFVDAPYTWLNDRLANHYGLEDIYRNQLASVDPNAGGSENSWVRVNLPDRRRGGVLTMGSTLTLTSLPLRTSPVYRGSWMLETIFNNPPPPPPAMVDELGDDDADLQAAGLTLRKKLESHRENTQCSVCHNRIDPPGFALENFDAVGRWRDRDGNFAVDATGMLSGQRVFDGPAEFKDAVLKEKDDFARGLIEHLLSYALNRQLQSYDVRTVSEISRAVSEDDYRLSRVIVEIVKSYPFRHARTD